METKLCLIFGFVFFIAGSLIYLFLQQDTSIGHYVLSFIKIKRIHIDNHWLRILLCNYFADYCWASSFTFFMQSILKLSKTQVKYLFACTMLGIIFEVFQFFCIVRGTADIYDVFVYGAGTITAIAVIKIIKKCKGGSL